MNQPDMNRSKTALIVDDSEINQDILSTYLQELGYQTYRADDGDTGLEKFKANKPYLTFLDIVMPKKSGLTLLSEIKETDPKAIVIMVSSFITPQNIEEARKANADWFLKKPFTEEKLAEIVKHFENVIN